VQADDFYPLAFDGSGKVVEAAFIQAKIDKDKIYRRLEYHKLEGNTVTVQNKAFESTYIEHRTNIFDENLGREISLRDVPEWASLQPETKIDNVDRLMFAYFKMPEANTIDPHSPLGVSGYSRAIGLIKEADKQYSRLLWEYEATEAAIDVDRDALTEVTDLNGNTHTVNPTLQARLFRPIDLGESNTYQPFLPTIRDASLINGLNNILMRIEDVCALSRGTISDVAAEARTATELKILKQRSYSANAEIQKTLENTLKDVVYIMNVYCVLYGITTEGEYDVSFEWDDSILVDVDTELTKRLTLMQNGLSSKIEIRMWYFGETEQQAREKLQQIEEENKQDMENQVMNQFSSEPTEGGNE
jgi:A118 family predicted phage portal protein